MTDTTVPGVQGQDVHAQDFPERGFDVVTGALSYSGAQPSSRARWSGRAAGCGRPPGIPVGPLRTLRSTSARSTSTTSSALPHRSRVQRRCTTPTGCASRMAESIMTVLSPTPAPSSTAARHAGVERIVHVSITHPSISSPYGYFRGKALVEPRPGRSRLLPYAVLRPAILFGGNGVLINNIAWLLRHLPVFGVGSKGDYRDPATRPSMTFATLAVAASTGHRHGDRCRRSGPAPRSSSWSPSSGRRSGAATLRCPRVPGPCQSRAGLTVGSFCCGTCC